MLDWIPWLLIFCSLAILAFSLSLARRRRPRHTPHITPRAPRSPDRQDHWTTNDPERE